MVDDKKNFKKKWTFYFLIGILSVVLLFYCGLIIYSCCCCKRYDHRVFPNTYLQDYDLSNVDFTKFHKVISGYEKSILDGKIILRCNGANYEYSLKDLGASLDVEKIFSFIKKDQASYGYFERLIRVHGDAKKSYPYFFRYDKNVLESCLVDLKSKVDVSLLDGHFSMTDGILQYVKGVNSYSLNVNSSLAVVAKAIEQGVHVGDSIELLGDIQVANNNESYENITTKVSSFSTTFNPYISRATNLKTALNYINGAIVEPGEVFSFFKYAGPYNKKGYIFYYEFVGNGVCQIATTVYNTALLGGLEIVKRYPHAAKSPYVAGGLDATVASYSSGWNVDFQFRNTYAYPIYISAYAVGGTAYVDFWSHADAKQGKTYSTESVRIGMRGYTTYLHTYQNGVEISKDKIATTWYSED